MTEPFSQRGLANLRNVLARHVESGHVPGLVALVSKDGQTHVEVHGTMTEGGGEAVTRDAIFRLASITKLYAAAAAMTFVDECRIRLDDSLDDLLPELANVRVLRTLESPLDDTVEKERPISLRDLLTFRLGTGLIMAMPGTYPVQQALEGRGMWPGPTPPTMTSDEYLRRLGEVPLLAQPGTRWFYDTSAMVLSALIARLAGKPFGQVLRERILEPVGAKSTGYVVPAGEEARLPAQYLPNESGTLDLVEPAGGGYGTTPPLFECGSTGLVSTVDDVAAFLQMLLDRGRSGGEQVLSRSAVELMTMNHLEPEEIAGNEMFFGGNSGWGFGMSAYTKKTSYDSNPGRFGWVGGTGTAAYADPSERFIGVLLTQRMMTGPEDADVFDNFWTAAYAALT